MLAAEEVVRAIIHCIWSVLVASYGWVCRCFRRDRLSISACTLIPYVASYFHGVICHPVPLALVHLPALVPVIIRAPHIVKLLILDPTIECPRALTDNPVDGERAGPGVRGQVLAILVSIVYKSSSEQGTRDSEAPNPSKLVLKCRSIGA